MSASLWLMFFAEFFVFVFLPLLSASIGISWHAMFWSCTQQANYVLLIVFLI